MSDWIDIEDTLPGLRGVIVHAVAASEEPRVRAALAAAEFKVHVIEGADVVDPVSFFAQIKATMAVRDYFGENWDAFNDSLWDLCGRVAFLWHGTDLTFAADAQTVISAVQGFVDAGLEPIRDTTEDMLQLEVFLFGDGPGFHRLGG